MKRFNKTAVALATAGALTLGVAPAAFAQGTPVTIQQGDLIYDKDGNLVGSYGSTDNGAAVLKPGDVVYNANSENVTADRLNTSGRNVVAADDENDAKNLDDLLNDPNAVGNNRAEDEKGYKRAADSDNDLKPEDLPQGGVAGANSETYVPENGIDNPAELKPEDVFKEDGTTVDKDKLKKVLIGLGATAGVLTIAGIVYKIVKNSKGEPVLVPADRADQAPTAADEAKTQELLENNAAEIAAQAGAADATTGDAATADRGVGAATGNNTIAKGLVGLLIASIMGAAAFAFGRRRLV